MQLRFASVPSALCGSVADATWMAWCLWRSRRKRERAYRTTSLIDWHASVAATERSLVVLFSSLCIYIFNISLAIGRQLITIEIGLRAGVAAVPTSPIRVTAPPRCSGFDAHNKVHCHTYLLTATPTVVWVNGFWTATVPSRAPRVGVARTFLLIPFRLFAHETLPELDSFQNAAGAFRSDFALNSNDPFSYSMTYDD